MQTKTKRRNRKHTAEHKISEIKHAYESYKREGGDLPPVIQNIMRKYENNRKTLIKPSGDITVDEALVQREISHYEERTVRLKQEDLKLSKELLRILGIPYFDSLNEAETLCSYFCLYGKVDAVLSNDTDVLAYGTPVFLTKLSLTKGEVTRIQYEDIVTGLGMTRFQIRDLCIMCGNDYNDNINQIGPEKAFKLLEQYGSIDRIKENTTHNTHVLNYKRSRTIFSVPDTPPDPTTYALGYKKADVDEFRLFAGRNNMRYNEHVFIEQFVSKDIDNDPRNSPCIEDRTCNSQCDLPAECSDSAHS